MPPASSQPHSSAPRPAALADTFYYLRNFQTVLHWVLTHHRDLLAPGEITSLDTLLALPQAPQALLVRMLMRKGEVFRSDALVYDEIGLIGPPLQLLQQTGLIQLDPAVSTAELVHLCRRAELHTLLKAKDCPLPASASKAALVEYLVQHLPSDLPRPFSQYWPTAAFQVIGLQCSALMERVRLLFFGNLRQDWREFVLAELGHQRYQQVAFSPASRAFRQRAEVDSYLALHHCQQALLEEDADPTQVVAAMPEAQSNPWLEHRRQRLLFTLAHIAERQGALDFASHCYGSNSLPRAQIRYFRLAEKTPQALAQLPALQQVLAATEQPEARLLLGRIEQRLRRKAGLSVPRPNAPSIKEQTLRLPFVPDTRVEAAVMTEISSLAQPAYYVENQLFPALLGLLLWPLLFSPLPGAFFHPFQAGPADLFRSDFVSRRRQALAQRLALLESNDYRQIIIDTYRQKRGLNCTLVNWPALSEALVALALDCIPSRHLRAIFQQLLADLRNHRRGLPDLIHFDPQRGRYQLIEVKGPGDRLQDAQRLWLAVFQRHGIPAKVLHVRWQEATR